MKWWRTLSARERRTLLAGAVLTVASLGYSRVARPVAAHLLTVRESLVRERDLDARERRLLAAAAAQPGRLTRASETLERSRDRFFSGPDTLTATAALSRYVRELARDAGTALESADPEPAAAEVGLLTAIRIRFRASGDLQGLLELVDGLRRGTKQIRIVALGIAPAQSLPAWESPEREALVLAADVEAWALIGEEPE